MRRGMYLTAAGAAAVLVLGLTLRSAAEAPQAPTPAAPSADTGAVVKPAESKPTTVTKKPKKPQVRDLPAFLGPLPKVKDPSDNPTTDAKIELGRLLYFDPRLSGNSTVSCASCHNPALGFGDGLAKGVGINGAKLGRSSPSVLNAAYYKTQFWDGRAETLEDQAKGPLLNPNEMGATEAHVVKVVSEIPGYRERFLKVFGRSPSFDDVARAIAAFERICVDQDSPFDRYARGDDNAISEQALRGLEVFTLNAQCATCHSGPNFSDDKFHNLGILDGDAGRAAISKDPKDTGAFHTKSLRSITQTGPYMHGGSLRTLREVIDHYEKIGQEKDKNPALSMFVPAIKLTEEQKQDLEAFLKTLTGDKRDPRVNVIPELPQAE